MTELPDLIDKQNTASEVKAKRAKGSVKRSLMEWRTDGDSVYRSAKYEEHLARKGYLDGRYEEGFARRIRGIRRKLRHQIEKAVECLTKDRHALLAFYNFPAEHRKHLRTSNPRRNHAPAFKAKVDLAAIKGEKTLAELAHQFDVHPNKLIQRKAQLLEGAAGVLGAEARSDSAAPAIDLKSLHAKIGELTLENDFLEGAPSKVGLLSAKR